jgi:hypothetical protein
MFFQMELGKDLLSYSLEQSDQQTRMLKPHIFPSES